MFLKQIALAATALLASAAACAQVGVTADLGSTGAGVHLVVPMESDLNGRFGVNYYQHDTSKSSNGIDYDVKGKLESVDLLFDWYVRDGSLFHLTGGVLYNGSRFDGQAKQNAQGGYTINGNAYAASDIGSLSGRIDYRKAAPYLGIGWGNVLAENSHWHVGADLGVIYQGKANPALSTSASCSTSEAVCEALLGDLEAARTRLGSDIAGRDVYPVLRASIGYRF